MREVISTGGFPLSELLWASGLNTMYVLISLLFFNWNFNVVKRKGLLVRIGE
jgi:hypothetical protein